MPYFVINNLALFLLLLSHVIVNTLANFPTHFKFGVGTSAYQVEGGWSVADKGVSMLDHLTHTRPKFFNKTTGDIASDSYHFYKRDVEIISELNADFYLFSISWSRLLPNGFSNKISRDGLRYHNSLLDELSAKNITPYVTLYHWDLPKILQDIGGWTNPLMVDYFVDYAKVAFESFGSKVKTWITFNDPSAICDCGAGVNIQYHLPVDGVRGISDYLCSHHVLLAHGKTSKLYNSTFKAKQKGRVGIVLNTPWVEPETNSTKDLQIATAAIQFHFGRLASPIFSKSGDYPEYFKSAIANRSTYQGFPASRLPAFTPQEIQLLRGSSDFLGIAHLSKPVYKYKEFKDQRPHYPEPSISDDLGLDLSLDQNGNDVEWFELQNSGLYKVLNWIKVNYDNPNVIIAMSGLPTRSGTLDLDRVAFLQKTLSVVLRSIQNGSNVTAYSFWSLLDTFQWNKGYRERYGLYEVNFNSTKKTRIPRISALVYKNIIETRSVNPFFTPTIPKQYISSAHIISPCKFIFIIIIHIFYTQMMH